MGVKFVIGSVQVGSDTVRVYQDNGTSTTLLYDVHYGTTAQAVGMGTDGAFYAGGAPTSTVITRKWDSSGTEVTTGDWPIDLHAKTVRALTVDASNNLYAVNDGTTSFNHIYKYNSSGTGLWAQMHGSGGLYAVAVDSSGNVFVGGGVSSSVTTRKYNSAGSNTYNLNHGAIVRGIVVDSSGNLYTVGDSSSSVTTRKYNSSYTQQWTANHGAQCNGVAVDGDGNVYTVGVRTSNITTRKYQSDGTEITAGDWPLDHGADVQDCVFLNGYLYTTGTRNGSNITTRKYHPDGTLIWSLDVGAYTYHIAGIATADPIETTAPALSLPIALAVPVCFLADIYTGAPALALSINLRLPLLITDREDTPLGLALPIALALPGLRLEYPHAERFAEVYALTLDGVLLPFSAITCRRDSGMALTVTIPSASAALLAIVSAHEGGTLRVLRGPRLPDGTLQLDLVWSAALTTWAYRAGALNGEITLQAQAATTVIASRPRTLQQVSYQACDRGRQRVRCRIDSYLSPGDVALMSGGRSMIVADITYSIQPDQAFMEIQGI